MRLRDFDFRIKSPWPSLQRRDPSFDEVFMGSIVLILIVLYSTMMIFGFVELINQVIECLKTKNNVRLVLMICGAMFALITWGYLTITGFGLYFSMFFYNSSKVIRLKHWWYCFAGTDVRIKQRLDEDEIDMPDWRYRYDGYYTLTFLFKNDAILYKLKY